MHQLNIIHIFQIKFTTMEVSPESKRKKFFTKGEQLDVLKTNNFKISEVCKEITEELCPFDLSEVEAEDVAEKLGKLEAVSKILTARVSRLSADYKSRKFRKNKHLLEEKEFSCSQFSVLKSGDSESLVGSQYMVD